MPNPHVRIRKATPADIDHVVRIEFAAFGPGIMNRLIYPNGPSDDAKSKSASTMAKMVDPTEAETGASEDPKLKGRESLVYVAEIDPADAQQAPEMVAFASWEVWREPRTEEQWNVDDPVPAAEGANAEVLEPFIGGIHAMRRRNMAGDPSVCLRMLCCTPGRNRLGAGSALLRWGVELADREGLPIWLEASPQGYPLYRRFGFEHVDTLDLNVTGRWGAVREADEDWGANCGAQLLGVAPEGVFRTVGMRRLPVKH